MRRFGWMMTLLAQVAAVPTIWFVRIPVARASSIDDRNAIAEILADSKGADRAECGSTCEKQCRKNCHP